MNDRQSIIALIISSVTSSRCDDFLSPRSSDRLFPFLPFFPPAPPPLSGGGVMENYSLVMRNYDEDGQRFTPACQRRRDESKFARDAACLTKPKMLSNSTRFREDEPCRATLPAASIGRISVSPTTRDALLSMRVLFSNSISSVRVSLKRRQALVPCR